MDGNACSASDGLAFCSCAMRAGVRDDEKAARVQRTTVKSLKTAEKPFSFPEAKPATEFQEFKVAPALIEQYRRRREADEIEGDTLEAETLPSSSRASSPANDGHVSEASTSTTASPSSAWAAHPTIDTSGFPSTHAPPASELSTTTAVQRRTISRRRIAASVVMAIGAVLGFAAVLVIKMWPAHTEEAVSLPTASAMVESPTVASTNVAIAPSSSASIGASKAIPPEASTSIGAMTAVRPSVSSTPKATSTPRASATPSPDGKLEPDPF